MYRFRDYSKMLAIVVSVIMEIKAKQGEREELIGVCV